MQKAENGRTISVLVARHLMKHAEGVGVAAEEFLRRTGISRIELADSACRIDYSRHQRMLDFFALLEPKFLETATSEFPLLGCVPNFDYVCLNASSLRQALRYYATYLPLVNEFERIVLVEESCAVLVKYLPDFSPSVLPAQANLLKLVRLVRLLCPRISCEVELSYDRPPDARKICDLFGARVRFGSPENCLRFVTQGLDDPLPQHNPVLHPMLLGEANDELWRLRNRQSFSSLVGILIRTFITEPGYNTTSETLLERLCEHLGMSRWTLNRRLRREHTSFQELEIGARLVEAGDLLALTDLSIAEISDQVGFSSHSAFSRSFLANRGSTPMQFRVDAKAQVLQRGPF